MITLYPKDFATKEAITDYLDDWNEGKDKEDVIIYNDMASTFVSLSGGIMDSITMVLVAFAAISLVVSLIMVGIITYISVLERTKEIGVLNPLHAILLVIISVCLTMIGGSIPAKMASKKDPVEALRTE